MMKGTAMRDMSAVRLTEDQTEVEQVPSFFPLFSGRVGARLHKRSKKTAQRPIVAGQSLRNMQGVSVKLYVYELSGGLAASMSRALVGRQIDGIWCVVSSSLGSRFGTGF